MNAKEVLAELKTMGNASTKLEMDRVAQETSDLGRLVHVVLPRGPESGFGP